VNNIPNFFFLIAVSGRQVTKQGDAMREMLLFLSAVFSFGAIGEQMDITEGTIVCHDDHEANMFVRFTLEWLTDGADRYVPPTGG